MQHAIVTLRDRGSIIATVTQTFPAMTSLSTKGKKIAQ